MTLKKTYTTNEVEWTVSFLGSPTINEAQGTTVTQNSGATTGYLTTTVNEAAASSVTVTAAIGQTFDTATNLIIGGTTVVASGTLTSAVPVTTATASINLVGAGITGTNLAFAPVIITLTEAQRAAGVIRTDSYLNDGTLFQLDLSINGIFDVATNPNAEILGTSISEDADTARPFALSAELDYTTGILIITTSETIDSTPGSPLDERFLRRKISIQSK